jgi:hypothetical protein
MTSPQLIWAFSGLALACNTDMKVRSGWSSDYAKKKFDVELEDVDYPQLLAHWGIPVERGSDITAMEKFLLMYYQAESISVMTQVQYEGVSPEKSPRFVQSQERLLSTLKQVRQRLGVESSGSS